MSDRWMPSSRARRFGAVPVRGRASARAVLLLFVLVLGGGCAPSVEEPEVRLAGVSVGGLGLEGGLLNVRLRVVNPNRFGLEASGLEYALELAESGGNDAEWMDVADGRLDQDLRVDANDSVLVEIPVRFEYRDLGSAVRSLLARGTFDYRVTGRVQLEEPLGRMIPFRKRGAVDIFD